MRRGTGEAPHEPGRVVRLAQPFGLCQLFRPLAKDKGVRPTLKEQYQYGELHLRFSAREALGAPEQTLLLVLLELAHEQHRRRPTEHALDRAHRGEVGTQLWSSLHVGAQGVFADTLPTLMLNCTWSELHRRCGSASVGGAVTKARRQSLERLCEVTVWERNESTRQEHCRRLVSWLVGDDQRVHVALNQRLAAALLAPSYAQVLLSERLQLPSQTAMLVHAFLSTCLGIGKTMSIAPDTLVERLWPVGDRATPASTQRRRLSDVKAALRALGRLERWRVELGVSAATVTRRTARSPSSTTSRPSKATLPCPLSVPRARDMTRSGHFTLPDASFGEQAFWQKLKPVRHLPGNDDPCTTS